MLRQIVQTCYAKWLSICSSYCEFSALCRVELSLFFFFSFVVFLLVCVVCLCYHIIW